MTLVSNDKKNKNKMYGYGEYESTLHNLNNLSFVTYKQTELFYF
jgi:hypothetical protein